MPQLDTARAAVDVALETVDRAAFVAAVYQALGILANLPVCHECNISTVVLSPERLGLIEKVAKLVFRRLMRFGNGGNVVVVGPQGTGKSVTLLLCTCLFGQLLQHKCAAAFYVNFLNTKIPMSLDRMAAAACRNAGLPSTRADCYAMYNPTTWMVFADEVYQLHERNAANQWNEFPENGDFSAVQVLADSSAHLRHAINGSPIARQKGFNYRWNSGKFGIHWFNPPVNKEGIEMVVAAVKPNCEYDLDDVMYWTGGILRYVVEYFESGATAPRPTVSLEEQHALDTLREHLEIGAVRHGVAVALLRKRELDVNVLENMVDKQILKVSQTGLEDVFSYLRRCYTTFLKWKPATVFISYAWADRLYTTKKDKNGKFREGQVRQSGTSLKVVKLLAETLQATCGCAVSFDRSEDDSVRTCQDGIWTWTVEQTRRSDCVVVLEGAHYWEKLQSVYDTKGVEVPLKEMSVRDANALDIDTSHNFSWVAAEASLLIQRALSGPPSHVYRLLLPGHVHDSRKGEKTAVQSAWDRLFIHVKETAGLKHIVQSMGFDSQHFLDIFDPK